MASRGGQRKVHCSELCSDRSGWLAAEERRKNRNSLRVWICTGCGAESRGRKRTRCRKGCGYVKPRRPRPAAHQCRDCGLVLAYGKHPTCVVCSHQPRLSLCPGCHEPFNPWGKRRPNGLRRARAAQTCGRQVCRAYRSIRTAFRERLFKPLARVGARACLWCLESFTPRGEHQRCCSKRCRTYIESRRRKLRLRGLETTVISTAAVYQRDRGRCGLCRRHVNKALKYPHPRAATIDHIVPITQGGRHVHANVQLAHAGCNIKKGNRLCGSQLRLLG